MTEKVKVSKTDLVRKHYEAHPHAKPREYVEALAAQGVKISAPVVSQILHKIKHNDANGKAESNGRVGAKEIDLAISFIHEVGGIERAKTIIQSLSSAAHSCLLLGLFVSPTPWLN